MPTHEHQARGPRPRDSPRPGRRRCHEHRPTGDPQGDRVLGRPGSVGPPDGLQQVHGVRRVRGGRGAGPATARASRRPAERRSATGRHQVPTFSRVVRRTAFPPVEEGDQGAEGLLGHPLGPSSSAGRVTPTTTGSAGDPPSRAPSARRCGPWPASAPAPAVSRPVGPGSRGDRCLTGPVGPSPDRSSSGVHGARPASPSGPDVQRGRSGRRRRRVHHSSRRARRWRRRGHRLYPAPGRHQGEQSRPRPAAGPDRRNIRAPGSTGGSGPGTSSTREARGRPALRRWGGAPGSGSGRRRRRGRQDRGGASPATTSPRAWTHPAPLLWAPTPPQDDEDDGRGRSGTGRAGHASGSGLGALASVTERGGCRLSTRGPRSRPLDSFVGHESVGQAGGGHRLHVVGRDERPARARRGPGPSG